MRRNFWFRYFNNLGGEIMARIVFPLYLFAALQGDIEIAWQREYALTDPERAVFGNDGCGDPCVVSSSPGGWVTAFRNMAAVIHRDQRLLIIDGPCYSACATMADFARPLTCVTPQASFHFHMGYTYVGKGAHVIRLEPPASRDIRQWIMTHGGFPYVGFREMKFQDAISFWPVCLLRDRGDRIYHASK